MPRYPSMIRTSRERLIFDLGLEMGREEGTGKYEDPFDRIRPQRKPKRKLSAWNKFVKANSKKKIYRYANGKLKLKKMGIAFRKTRAGRKR